MGLPEETLNIHTPENVAFGYQVAGIGSRFLAALADTAIILVLQFLVAITYFITMDLLNIDPFSTLSSWSAAAFGLLLFVFFWGYYILFEIFWNGQTPGKRWSGLRVIRNDGTPVTLSESIIRNLVRIIDLLPAAYGIGVITMFLDKKSRRLGDLAAGTLVVHDRTPITIQSLSVKRAINFKPQGVNRISLDGFPIERLTNEDISLIEDFLSRRDQLTHRDTLAIQILNTLHTRLGLPQPAISRIEAEDTLLAILQAVQKKDE
jgi:uncharacterized RDD family membrane protein YckC